MARPTGFADIVRLLAALPALPAIPDEFATAVHADTQLATQGERRHALLWLGQAQRRFPPQLGAAGMVGIALYAGPHAGMDTDWPALLAPWQIQGQTQGQTEGKASIAPALQHLQVDPALDLDLYELAGAPIADATQGPALTETQAAHAMAYGMMAVKPDLSLLALSTIGDRETGAGISALAVMAALLKRGPDAFNLPSVQAGRIAVMLDANRAILTDPLSSLAALGGHESCAIFGAILAARLAGYPVLLEGLPALAAALTLARLAGTVAQARDLLGHVRATSLPSDLATLLSPYLQPLPGFTAIIPKDAARQTAQLLAELRQLTA